MRIQFILFIFLAAGELPANGGGGCNIFVDSPNATSYKSCLAYLSASSNLSVYTKELSQDKRAFGKLLLGISKGNPYSLRIVMRLFKSLDGAYKEDAAIETGKYLHRDARLVLLLFVKNDFSKEDMELALLNYGDKYVDDLARIQNETRTRMALISAIHDRGMADIREKSLSILRNFADTNAKMMAIQDK